MPAPIAPRLTAPALMFLVLAGGGCGRQGAVRVVVNYEHFEPGCLEVSAADASGSSADTLGGAVQLANEKLTGATSVTVGVAPQPGWSTRLALRVRSFERACEGTPVEEQSTEVTLQPGAVEEWAVTLTARDGDRDGYAAAAAGVNGGDCDDSSALISPAAEEECGAVDTNCNGLIACLDPLCVGRACDDGLASTTQDVCTPTGGCAGTALTDCQPGTWVTQQPTGNTPRECTPCPAGTYSASINASVCVAWNDCMAGQRVTTPPGSTVDRGCAPCEVGTYSTMPNSSACAPVGTCAAGSAPSGPPSMTSPLQCAACMVGTYCAGGTATAEPCAPGFWDDDANPASMCVAWTQCAPGTAPSMLGTPTTNLVCAPCAVGTYCPGLQTPSTPCSTGTWDHDANPATACVPWTGCALGSAVSAPGTATTDVTCAPCAAGNYCPGQLDPAEPCATGTWDDDSSASTACVPWADCPAGTSITTPGSATINRACSPCVGSYSTMTNVTSCTPYTQCTAGQFVSTPGTTTTNQACSACASGTFTATPNATSCTPWSTCGDDTYESAPPSASADRVCSNYVNCLDRSNRVPGMMDGFHVIDPDGPGGVAPFPAYCVMSIDGGGWTAISYEDFSMAATGWSDSRRDTSSSCFADWGAMLGGHQLFGSGVSTSKTYSFFGIPHTTVRVSLDYFVIDSWDDERARVSVDGTLIYDTAFTLGGSNTCGGIWGDRGRQSVAGTRPHTTNSMTLTITSTLNQTASDESFGVDNVLVMIR